MVSKISNELTLSTDINIITAEINSYKQIAGQSIFEIGKRLKHVKEKDLAHGEWEKWLSDNLNMSKGQAYKYIRVYEEFTDVNVLSTKPLDALYYISTLPEEEKQKPHVIPSTGQEKMVDEMTVKELREVKAELKRSQEELKVKDEQLKKERQEKELLQNTVESLEYQDPKVIEKVVEKVKEVIVDRTDYSRLNKLQQELNKEKNDNTTLESKLLKLSQEKLTYESQLKQIEEFQRSEQAEIEKLKKQKEKLELQAHISISSLQIGIHKFIEDYSPSVFLQGAVAASAGIIKDDLLDSVIALEEFTQKLREILDSKIVGKNIIEINY